MWSEIDPALPRARIEVLGPAPTSGTRDTFLELVLAHSCRDTPEGAQLVGKDADFDAKCRSLRDDGLFIEVGENFNLIVQRLEANRNAFGMFGFPYLEQNRSQIKASPIEGVVPERAVIASGQYVLSRPLFFYVKKAQATVVPGVAEYAAEFTSPRAIGANGYLVDQGLVPLSEADLRRNQEVVAGLRASAVAR